eukprot:scaffold641_cov237-Pinguiococcus_pyrenoidosus.AAC.2
MVRHKSTPEQRVSQAPPPSLTLRVRHPGGVRRVEMPGGSTLAALRARVEADLGPLVALSARGVGGSAGPMFFIRDGQYPGAGQLFIGPEATLESLGLRSGDMLESRGPAAKAQPSKNGKRSAPAAASAGSPKRPRVAGSPEELAIAFLTSIPEGWHVRARLDSVGTCADDEIACNFQMAS